MGSQGPAWGLVYDPGSRCEWTDTFPFWGLPCLVEKGRWGPGVTAYLIQEALRYDDQGEGDRVQAEEDVITVHGVHAVGVFEEKLLLGGGGEKLGGEGQSGHRPAS